MSNTASKYPELDERDRRPAARSFDNLVPTVIEFTAVVRMALAIGTIFAVIGTCLMAFSAYTLHVGQAELRGMIRVVEQKTTCPK